LSERKLTNEQRDELLQRYHAGDSLEEIAADYGITAKYAGKYARSFGVKRAKPIKQTGSGINAFAKRARSILWRQDHSREKPTYDKWEARVRELQEQSECSKSQAIVRASKEFPCLTRLFKEYDVRDFDPNPESHPEIKHYGDKPTLQQGVFCEGIEQSYKDSLRWAIQAAGAYLRTGKSPKTCPCDAAWYLYRQAIEEPRDFMGRISQIEAKGDPEEADRRSMRKKSARSISEIDAYLDEIDKETGYGNQADELLEQETKEP